MAVASLQSLNDDVLGMIVGLLSQPDTANLVFTSRAVSSVARRHILSSLVVSAPAQSLEFHRLMLEEDDGYRIQCLQRLTIIFQDSVDEPTDAGGYSPLATVLARARNLRELVMGSLEKHLTMQSGKVLSDAIASLSDLCELELRDIGKQSVELCERLTCEPKVVCLAADPWTEPAPYLEVEYSRFAGLPVLRNASTITLQHLSLTRNGTPESQPAPVTPWSSTRTLRLENMDPLALIELCPNLTTLRMGFMWFADNGSTLYPDDAHSKYITSLARDVRVDTRVRVLDVFVGNEELALDKTIIATTRATLPVVLSIQFHYGDAALWAQLAELFKHTDARLRYLDVLMHDESEYAQTWFDECLPLLSSCPILCVRLKFVQCLLEVMAEDEFASIKDRPEPGELIDSEWEELRDAAPKLLAETIPSLRYIAVSSGYMVGDLAWSTFGGGWARWWNVAREALENETEGSTVELVEIDEGEGRKVDEYMRSAWFAKTLQFHD
ncbi:uncharacterized protein C8Q71DRAFT_863312 [Rhodofomes roseus]|uniref:F-box domain-containing protein n=1 Tax=Rhodofomes roseus TaxID=34475 RepID=A0ABQ8JYL0_9APHY|nr:uncharacterized protein C8Q71DRAFT_863312 [Rhodofomes roseus]KAH9829385.1 hypothetical protein C8Q71DRAFT_863312 [Rhodofomes roseus]